MKALTKERIKKFWGYSPDQVTLIRNGFWVKEEQAAYRASWSGGFRVSAKARTIASAKALLKDDRRKKGRIIKRERISAAKAAARDKAIDESPYTFSWWGCGFGDD